MLTRKTVWLTALLALAVFLGWRFIRPMNIFVVSPAFERPIDSSLIPAGIDSLSAESCGKCHTDIYKEWLTTIHSQAWTDPYFQVDWHFDGADQICKNCHIPLDRQQEHLVLGFNDRDKFDPILAPNPDFDPALQQEGVTCAACHVRDGVILGPYGISDAPHPVKKIDDTNRICVPCHVVQGDRWDTFFRMPPCGTVAEIRSVDDSAPMTATDAPPAIGNTREIIVGPGEMKCVNCHMPALDRPLTPDGPVRATRRHLWRGGHDPAMVRQAMEAGLVALPEQHRFKLTLTNTGAAHYLPTGTPDRHLSVHLRLRDANGAILDEQTTLLKRTMIWRPFIIELTDTRLPRWQPREFVYEIPDRFTTRAASIEAEVRYHLLTEARRARIDYRNQTPIDYPIFEQRLELTH